MSGFGDRRRVKHIFLLPPYIKMRFAVYSLSARALLLVA